MKFRSIFGWRSALLTSVLALGIGQLSPSAHAYTTDTYQWGQMPIGGGGNITSLVIHPKVKDVMYQGADVGAVDRWDETNQRWVPTLNYKGAPQGCDALAVDPSDTSGNTVWAAMGSYDWSPGVILKSTNRGATWYNPTTTTFPNCSNGSQGWNNRLIVDPANGNVVYFAARNGLWRTTDGGTTWTKITSAPAGNQAKLGTGKGVSGTIMVIADPTSGTVSTPTRTKRLYLSALGSPLYKTEDGGTTWTVMPGAPTNVSCASISPAGVLYCAARSTGGVTGGLYKLSGVTASNPAGTWTTIHPFANDYYSSIQVDPFDQNNILAFANYTPLYSKDGGQTWPYIASWQNQTVSVTPSWYSTQSQSQFGWGGQNLRYDPFRQGTVWESDSYMTWKTSNIYASPSPVHWSSFTAGHEETVGLAGMTSPSSGPAFLFSGAADVNGFRHTSLTGWPTQIKVKKLGTELTITGADFQESDPSFVAFVGAINWDSPGDGGYTTDGGLTYTSFASPDTHPANQGGRIAVSANSRTLVWSTGYPNQSVYRSTDLGTTWTKSTGLPASYPVDTGYNIFTFMNPLCSDRVNGNKFYVYHKGGSIYRSDDGGVSFTQVATGLPATVEAKLVANHTQEGDLWLSLKNIGLYHLTNSGSTWTKLSNVQSCGTVTIGKGPNSTTPSIYIVGKVDGATTEGFFRSDDLGVSWSKIDISQPYPNGWTYICGDRQTYGNVYVESSTGIYYGKKLTTPSVGVNAGGSATGIFAADTGFSGGATVTPYTGAIDTTGVTYPASQSLYQTYRYGNSSYTLGGFVPNSSHTVRLHFCENYWTTSGSRTFNVSINGTPVLYNYDIFKAAGAARKAVIPTFTANANASGQYVISFTTVKDNAQINGIEVQ